MTLPCGCPEHAPDWDNKDVDLSRHPAHILPIASFFHMPLSYDLYVRRQQLEVQHLELIETWPGLVFTHTAMFGGRIMRLVASADSPSRRVQCLPGDFSVRGKLHEGGIGSLRKSALALQSALFDLGRMPKELYLCHLTCPRCSEARGGDRILLVRRYERSAKLERKLK